jgi:hypothetical protein
MKTLMFFSTLTMAFLLKVMDSRFKEIKKKICFIFLIKFHNNSRGRERRKERRNERGIQLQVPKKIARPLFIGLF